MAETPILHLTLGADDQVNRNWQILDDVMHRLAKGVQITDDLSILGSLDVRDNLHVGGTSILTGQVSAPTGIDTGILTASTALLQAVTVSGALQAQAGLTVSAGPVVLPNQSIDGAAFMKSATVQTVAVGTARTTELVLTATPQQVASVTLDASEELGRWQVIFAQATFRVSFGSATVPSSTAPRLTLRRASTDLQSRSFPWSTDPAPSPYINRSVPVTMVRITQPGDLAHDYSLWGDDWNAIGGGNSAISFAQLHVIQLR
jgi:hypothetical protein